MLAPLLPVVETELGEILQMGFFEDGACGIRTRALRLAKPALSQLS
jgi:hypothetical protein